MTTPCSTSRPPRPAAGLRPATAGKPSSRTFNEVTPRKTAEALRLLASGRRTKTYNLGELMTNGFPAFRTDPPRV